MDAEPPPCDPVPPAGTHLIYDGSHARPAPYRGLLGEGFRGLCRLWLWLTGWQLRGDWPDLRRVVLVAAPHSSNWDGVHMLAAAGAYRVTLRWMGKASLTQGPFGGLVRWAGCVPIDRSQSHDVVAAMTAAFAAAPAMVLAVPPEGTRSTVRKWKTGFYHIAVGAGVPLVFAVLDYGSNTISISGALWPTGDYDADLAVIETHYAKARGRTGVGSQPDA